MARKGTRKTTDTGAKQDQSAKGSAVRAELSRGEPTMGRVAVGSSSAKSEESGGTATATLNITHEMIAARAKQIWEQRGRPQGEDERNWREAERQLKKELGAE